MNVPSSRNQRIDAEIDRNEIWPQFGVSENAVNVPAAAPSYNSTRTVQVVSVSGVIFVAWNNLKIKFPDYKFIKLNQISYNWWSKNSSRHEKCLMVNQLFREMLRKRVSIW